MVSDEQIDIGEFPGRSFSETIHELEQQGREEEADDLVRDRFQDEFANSEYDVTMEDYDTVLVEMPSFTGYHTVSFNRGAAHAFEMGMYCYDGTDYEFEAAGPMGEIRDVVSEHHNTEHPGEAALTVGERNPQLGGRF